MTKRIVFVTRKRANGRRKSRGRIGSLSIVFYVVLIVSAAILAEIFVIPALWSGRKAASGTKPPAAVAKHLDADDLKKDRAN